MDDLGLIATVAVATYLTRVAGFALGEREVPPTVGRFLSYVPVAAFAALAAPGVAVGGEIGPRLLAVVAAAVAVLRLGRLWVGLAAGMGAYWLARLLLGT